MDNRGEQLLIMSNRLPVVVRRRNEQWCAEPGAGGLVQAMTPVLGDGGGCWVGWPGVTLEDGQGWEGALARVSADAGFELAPVVLSQRELENFYEGFANSVIWPLFHGFADRCTFAPEFYDVYGAVNEKFTDVVSAHLDPTTALWVHDYHLFEVARRLRHRGHRGRLAFYLHIPFPSVENFSKLPWRKRLLSDLLAYDLVGFQTGRDVHHFMRATEALGIGQIVGHRVDEAGMRVKIAHQGHVSMVGAFPIGIDYDDFNHRAESEAVDEKVARLKTQLGPYQVLLGVDRLDYSKGLLQRLRAYEMLLAENPGLREAVVLFQLVVPSRENVAAYQALKREFDRLVGRINGRFSTTGWQPIQYMYNRVDPVELSALYRLADVAVVTPLRDGMNLVSKEYCASQVDGDGVLVLSEFAGAAEQLRPGALLVNPYDTQATAQALARAIDMDRRQRRRRMVTLQQIIASSDVYWWADQFLTQAQQSRRAPSPVGRSGRSARS